MKITILTIILGLCLVGATTWAFIAQVKIQEQETIIWELERTVAQQKDWLDQAWEEYDKLRGYYDKVNEYYAQSQKDVTNLRQEVADFKQEVADFKQEVADFKQEVADLKQEIAQWEYAYESKVAYYEAKLEIAKFTFYYVSPSQRYGVDDLEEYLQRWEWREGTYVRNKFDCSEMSAYIERNLENEGYHTVILAGKNPSGDGKHAWLLVEASDGKYMPVEATAYSIVYWSNPYFDNYFIYDYKFETIQEALEYSPTEFSWWE